MKMYETTQSVEKYLNVKLECDCGKIHYAPIKAVDIGEGALTRLPQYVLDFGYKKPYILCDTTTYRVAGQKCEELLKAAGLNPTVLMIKHLGFDEATLGEIVINKPDDCDLMIGCGTGSITDMLRYASFKLNCPCFTVCTGAPMDGFSASVGIMNVNNLKATMPAHSTEVIIGDTDILSGAPYRMTIAGFADLMGKLSAHTDWNIASLVKEDHYCRHIDHLVCDYVADIIGKADEVKERAPQAIGDVMNALLLTGAVISLYGDSRAISGAEHHMSHYWEVLGDQKGRAFAMHGEQVAVGTVLALMLEKKLSQIRVNFEQARRRAKSYDPEKWKQEIQRAYGNAADAILELEEKTGKNAVAGRLHRIDLAEQHWDELQALLEKAYPWEKLHAMLKNLGCPCEPKDIGLTAEILKDTFLYSKDTRNRYTVCQLAWDLGVIDELSDSIIEDLRSMSAVL